jgi:hypothetical protein
MNTKQTLQRSALPAAIISIIVSAIYWMIGNMLGDYVVRLLAKYDISVDAPIAWILAWVLDSPLNILIFTFIVTLIISLLIDKYKDVGKNVEKIQPTYTTPSNAENGSAAASVGINYGQIKQNVVQKQSDRKEPPIVDIKGNPYIKDGKMNQSLTSLPILGGGYKVIPIFINVLFAQVNISNLPKEINADSTAKNVRAEITYYKPDKTIIGSVNGRWAGEGNSNDEEIVELLSNGKPRILYLAMKYNYEDKKDLYMYGMETDTTYFFNRHKDKSYRIDENQIFIKVEIIGERVQLTKEFVLYNEETGLRIEMLK